MPCPVSRFRTNENVAKGLSRENITRTRYQEFAREKKLSDMTISEMIRKSSSFLCALCHSNRKGKLLELCYHYNFKKKNPNHSLSDESDTRNHSNDYHQSRRGCTTNAFLFVTIYNESAFSLTRFNSFGFFEPSNWSCTSNPISALGDNLVLKIDGYSSPVFGAQI